MKKLLAVALAALLAMGTTAIAFAEQVEDLSVYSDLYLYDEEAEDMEDLGVGSTPVPSGSILYIPITAKVDGDDGLEAKTVLSASDYSNYRLRLSVQEGKDLVERVGWAVKYVNRGRRDMFIAVYTNHNTTGENADVAFTLRVVPQNGATTDGFDDSEMEYEYSFVMAPKAAAQAQTQKPEEQKPAESAPEQAQQPSTSAPTANPDAELNPETGAPVGGGMLAAVVLLASVAWQNRKMRR